ncbi:hypothetical protein EV200_107109 [Pedobacter psychrotolerans]|uniref:Carboxypeptidase family protein n=1 Tax=Pedobacter psychrotolerans TaxID=1843235 RepID=A0A4R2H6R9_9SPHI|nr:hypothetical protein [Pedobacter psychrotolerans]TCO21515.1 hypothetical protein EV200_107109 [Pedobacter psychrotolerans]GGE39193.1 hypothetical protein GCM10011413_01000 [Pedobacter psychrotolerans]
MKLKFTRLFLVALALYATGCSKDDFSEADAIAAQKELLTLKYQHEMDLETLKQKGANALQQLINTAALQQLKLNDSLARTSAVAAAKQDYSVAVTDVVTNAPVADAEVIVSSEGKLFSTKTSAQGIATFSSLYLFPTSTFLITKTGYAATQIMRKDITLGTAKLWNTAELSNEISGTLYIDTDLTNSTPEKVGGNVLVTASTSVPNGFSGTYSVQFPTYTTATGTYSLKLPAAPGGYALSFAQIEADQKLYVYGTEDTDASLMPFQLPYMASVKTYFNVNSYGVNIPSIISPIYLKFPKDKLGRELYMQVNGNYNSTAYLSSIADGYQIERLNVSSYNYYNGMYYDLNQSTFDANTKLDVSVIDITGNIIKSQPLLSATTNSSGKLQITSSVEGGYGYVHLRRDAAGRIVANAKGVISKATVYDSSQNLYVLTYTSNLNFTTNLSTGLNYLLPNKGDKRIVNFYYGAGESRVKKVY